MKVSMLTETSWDGKSLHIGDEVEVPNNVGQRWCNRKIAAALGGIIPNQDDKIKTLKIAELKEQAKQLGIEGYKKMDKDQLVAAIAESQRAVNLALIMQDEEVVKALAELDELQKRLGKVINLDLSDAETLTKEQLLEKIAQAKEIVKSTATAEKEAEELAALKIQADALGIEGFDEMSKEKLVEAIKTAKKD